MSEPKKLTALEKIDQRLEQLRNRRAVIVQRETGEQRKLRNRRASILGGWIMANEPEKMAAIVAALQRPQDIAAFSDLATATGETANIRGGEGSASA